MVHRGKRHKNLGTTINYNTKGNIVFTVFDYIHDVLDKSPEEFHGWAETPAANHLFDVEKESEKLNKEYGILFHHLLAKLLYLSNSERLNIQTDV